MFGILCKAADLGFPVFLLLTTDNVVLQQQTLDRVKSDLDGFVFVVKMMHDCLWRIV